jgi:hypothetical protein
VISRQDTDSFVIIGMEAGGGVRSRSEVVNADPYVQAILLRAMCEGATAQAPSERGDRGEEGE